MYVNNILDVAVKQKVGRIILNSFPHVEGKSTPDKPARSSLVGKPQSIHANTELEEEKLLFKYAKQYHFEPVSLRVGMVYGAGILMIDAEQWFAKYALLGIWRKPRFIHLISIDDFVEATIAAATKSNINGIYHLGDKGIKTLKHFLDDITLFKENHKPWRTPVWMIMTAAIAFELFSFVFGTQSPLIEDFIKIGMASYYGDTTRMHRELLPQLKNNTYKEGIHLF